MFFIERHCRNEKRQLHLHSIYLSISNIYLIYRIRMTRSLLFLLVGILFFSCKKNKTSSDPVEIQYQYIKKRL